MKTLIGILAAIALSIYGVLAGPAAMGAATGTLSTVILPILIALGITAAITVVIGLLLLFVDAVGLLLVAFGIFKIFQEVGAGAKPKEVIVSCLWTILILLLPLSINLFFASIGGAMTNRFVKWVGGPMHEFFERAARLSTGLLGFLCFTILAALLVDQTWNFLCFPVLLVLLMWALYTATVNTHGNAWKKFGKFGQFVIPAIVILAIIGTMSYLRPFKRYGHNVFNNMFMWTDASASHVDDAEGVYWEVKEAVEGKECFGCSFDEDGKLQVGKWIKTRGKTQWVAGSVSQPQTFKIGQQFVEPIEIQTKNDNFKNVHWNRVISIPLNPAFDDTKPGLGYNDSRIFVIPKFALEPRITERPEQPLGHIFGINLPSWRTVRWMAPWVILMLLGLSILRWYLRTFVTKGAGTSSGGGGLFAKLTLPIAIVAITAAAIMIAFACMRLMMHDSNAIALDYHMRHGDDPPPISEQFQHPIAPQIERVVEVKNPEPPPAPPTPATPAETVNVPRHSLITKKIDSDTEEVLLAGEREDGLDLELPLENGESLIVTYEGGVIYHDVNRSDSAAPVYGIPAQQDPQVVRSQLLIPDLPAYAVVVVVGGQAFPLDPNDPRRIYNITGQTERRVSLYYNDMHGSFGDNGGNARFIAKRCKRVVQIAGRE